MVVSQKVAIWCLSTTSLEPISSKMPKLSPVAWHGRAVLRPARKTLCIFFEISPAEIFWIWKRDFSGGSPAINGRGGVTQGDTVARAPCK